MNRYILLALTSLLTVIFLFCLYFLISVGPEAMAFMEDDPYGACMQLTDTLDFGQALVLVFSLALIVIHLFYVLNVHFGRDEAMMVKLFVARPFSLTREVIYDAFVTVIALLIVGGIEAVQRLFDCGALQQAA